MRRRVVGFKVCKQCKRQLRLDLIAPNYKNQPGHLCLDCDKENKNKKTRRCIRCGKKKRKIDFERHPKTNVILAVCKDCDPNYHLKERKKYNKRMPVDVEPHVNVDMDKVNKAVEKIVGVREKKKMPEIKIGEF